MRSMRSMGSVGVKAGGEVYESENQNYTCKMNMMKTLIF